MKKFRDVGEEVTVADFVAAVEHANKLARYYVGATGRPEWKLATNLLDAILFLVREER